MKPSLKEIIWEAHPYKTRLEKLKLLRHLPDVFRRVSEVISILGLKPPPDFNASLCDITDDYLIIRDSTSLIATAYIGNDPKLLGHIILPDKQEITEHSYYQLVGKEPNEHGFIEGCGCHICQNAVLKQQARFDEDRMKRYEERACIIGLKPEEKIQTVSGHLQGLVDAPINIPRTPMTKITSPSINDERLLRT